MKTNFARVITVAGFSADASPNDSAPDAAQIWSITSMRDTGEPAAGHFLCGAFDTDEPTGMLGFRTWWLDETTGQWFIAGADDLVHRDSMVCETLISSTVFVQALSLANTGGASTFTLRAGSF